MATAAVIGGGLVVGSLISSRSQDRATEAAKESAQQAAEQAQPFIDAQEELQQFQSNLLGLGTEEEQASALAALQSSPVLQSLNQQSQAQNLRQFSGTGQIGAAAQALQDRNLQNILSVALGGASQAAATGAPIAGQAIPAISQVGQIAAQGALAQGQIGSNLVGGLTNIGAFGLGGGFQGTGFQNLGFGSPAAATPTAGSAAQAIGQGFGSVGTGVVPTVGVL